MILIGDKATCMSENASDIWWPFCHPSLNPMEMCLRWKQIRPKHSSGYAQIMPKNEDAWIT